MRRLLWCWTLVTLGVLPACKDSTGPADSSVTFPALPAAMLASQCVQGERTVNQGITGTIAETDCVLPTDSTYYEVWRIRVASSGSYRFDASSAFDNFMAVYRLDSYTETTATLSLQAFSDDRSQSNTNALITMALAPNTDYFLLVNGFDVTDVGPYTVAFTRP